MLGRMEFTKQSHTAILRWAVRSTIYNSCILRYTEIYIAGEDIYIW